MKKLKEKKGFTLVELIVVLVILAILAALLVPALTGYIDKAKRKQIVAETRQIVMASQTLIDEQYAKVTASTVTSNVTIDSGDKAKTGVSGGTITLALMDIQELSEVTGGTYPKGISVDGKGKITSLVYENGTKKCTYIPGGADNTDGQYKVEAATQ